MAKDFDDSDGVWRTIAGRKVFIREGQSLSSAMKQSGKFKSGKRDELIAKNRKRDEENFKKGITYEEYSLNKAVEKKTDGKYKSYDEIEKSQTKNLNDLEQERDAKFREIVDANTKRQDIYKDAGSDEAYKNLYGKEPEKNAKNQLSDSDYKKYEELTNQYHGGRKDLAKIDKQIEEYRKTHPKEETKKASGKFWEEAEKERQQIKAEATKTGKTVEEYEKQKTKEMFSKDNDGSRYLPKESEIKEQGKSNRKEVSDNIQAHILSYYDNPVDFMEQMDAMDYLPTKWRQGEEIAKGGSYLIYNTDMSDYLDSLKINPKGKKFSEDKAFNMYTSLVGRESEHLYNRLEKLFEQYKKEHKNSEVSLDDFRKWFK